MRLQIGIWQPVPPRIFVANSDKEKTALSCHIWTHKDQRYVFLFFWTSGIREQGNNNLMAAAKRVANDLMPFVWKKLGNDLMSFFSKEERLDRLASKCTLWSQSKKSWYSIVYLSALKKMTHRLYTNKHMTNKQLLHLYVDRWAKTISWQENQWHCIFDSRRGRSGKDKNKYKDINIKHLSTNANELWWVLTHRTL